MRFAAVTPIPRDPRQEALPAPASPAAQFLRRLVAQEPWPASAPGEPEPPFDLDQRVRLAGEW